MSKERDRLRAVLAEADELLGKMQAVAASHGYESFRALVEDLYRTGEQQHGRTEVPTDEMETKDAELDALRPVRHPVGYL